MDTKSQKKKTNNNYLALVVIAVNQLLDGVLTYTGISHFGTVNVEGNFILRNLMQSIGVLETIILAKVSALVLVMLLYLVTKYSPDRGYWFSIPLWFVAFVYSMSAVIWVYVLTKSDFYFIG